ncbi:long-chain fatty acid--CoA ligase [Salipiger sp. P9]|uniref:long-chain-fatty-acid--CoA ligase n=1 Tax=Salipiger pentaromativorans TaxID=2943193 RepID=UPI002157599B|nr:long-chain fatty acid--CoA ligase [Salipiger pentaromativorans]MCR8547581.1 long-chain fatty acid--CoA ligase [Salipiger pentaromativorans]
MLNLSILLEDSARRFPEREALVAGDRRLIYREVDAAANRVANLLVQRGLCPGDRVALSCANQPEFYICYYGILKAGGVVVPLNVMLKGREIAFQLTDSGARAYLCAEGSPELPIGENGRKGFEAAPGCTDFIAIGAPPAGAGSLAALTAGQPDRFDYVSRAASDTAVILYTSGTTGQPKGAELSHSNLLVSALTCTRVIGSLLSRHERHLVVVPPFHSFGATMHMNGGFGAGATLVLMPRFDPAQAVALMRQEKITFFAGVPTMYIGLLEVLEESAATDEIAATLRVALCGGAPTPVDVIQRIHNRLGVRVLDVYGLSECSLTMFLDPEQDYRPGSIGVPGWGIGVRLVDDEGAPVEGHGPEQVGEIVIRGPNVMKGYYNRPEENAASLEGGWFRTGDLARRDAEGFYYIVDRAKDLVIRGGYNVYPREIEEVLSTHPDVVLVAVVGVPDPRLGQEIKAVVVPRKGAALTADALIAWGKAQMANYKYPRIVEFRPELPMTSTGKILKRALRAAE